MSIDRQQVTSFSLKSMNSNIEINYLDDDTTPKPAQISSPLTGTIESSTNVAYMQDGTDTIDTYCEVEQEAYVLTKGKRFIATKIVNNKTIQYQVHTLCLQYPQNRNVYIIHEKHSE